MSNLEHDIENFVRTVHLLEENDKLKQALAEKDRLHANQISEVIERLNDDYRAVLIRHEKAYQQLMEKAVRFASTVEDANWVQNTDEWAAREFLKTPEAQAFLKEREGT